MPEVSIISEDLPAAYDALDQMTQGYLGESIEAIRVNSVCRVAILSSGKICFPNLLGFDRKHEKSVSNLLAPSWELCTICF